DDAEASAADVDRGIVEAVDVQRVAVGDHHLRVVADELIGSAADDDAAFEHAQLDLAQAFLSTGVRVGNQRAYFDSTLHRRLDRLLDLFDVEGEDEDVDRFFRAFNRVQNGFDAVSWLNNKLHAVSLRPSPTVPHEARVLNQADLIPVHQQRAGRFPEHEQGV